MRPIIGIKQASCVLLLTIFSTAARAEEPLVVGGLGDSITAGFNAVRLGDNREHSWSTGSSSQINSHVKRLAELKGRETRGFNESIAGSVVADLPRQVTRLLAKNPDYTTLAVGANDVCGWGDDYEGALEAYKTQLAAQIDRLVQARPAIKILLAPVPDLHNLWEVAHAKPTCQARWDLLGICSPLLQSGSTPAGRAAFVRRWEAINQAITAVARDYAANVLHDPDLAHMPFAWEDLSPMDCFHPSLKGQNLLAEYTWQLVLSSP